MLSQLRKRTTWFHVAAVVVAFTASFFVGKFAALWGKPEVVQSDGSQNKQASEEFTGNNLNVLLLGVDARPGEKDARSDSLIVVSIDRTTRKIAMVSIPRDSLVDIPGHGKSKINNANAVGGAELARETVEGLLGIEIPYYVKTNFEGFKEIVDTLGGVNLEVEKRMYYPSEGINLRPGMQRLDGGKALAYVRFRHDALGDISRTQRQQKFLTALAGEMLQASTIIKLPRLVPQLMDAVETNLGVRNAVFLARAASDIDPDNIVTATLPGSFFNYKGASYWKVDEAKTKVVLSEMFHGTKVATITGPDINVPADKPVYKRPKSQGSVVKIVPVGEDTGNNGSAESAKPQEEQGNTGNQETPSTEENNTGENKPDTIKPGLPPDAPADPVTPDSGEDGGLNQVPDGQTQPQQPTPGQVKPPAGSGTSDSAVPGANQSSTNGSTGKAGTNTTVTTPTVNIVTQG